MLTVTRQELCLVRKKEEPQGATALETNSQSTSRIAQTIIPRPAPGTRLTGAAAANNGDDARHIGSEHLHQLSLVGIAVNDFQRGGLHREMRT